MNISIEIWKAIFGLVCAQSIIVVFATPIDFETDSGNSYIIEPSEEYNWHQAWLACSEQNGELATINTEEKKQFLNKIFEKDRFQFKNLWIGAKADLYIDNVNITYTQWDQNQPNNSISEPLCVYITNNSEVSYSWRSGSCFDLYLGFICVRSEYSKPQDIKEQISFKNRDMIDGLSQYSLLSTDFNRLGNYTNAWKDLIRKTIRNTQINIVRKFFQIENIIARIKGIKEQED